MADFKMKIIKKINSLLPKYQKIKIKIIINDKSYSIDFDVTIKGQIMRCYAMVDNQSIDRKKLDEVFADIAKYVRSTPEYIPGQLNKYTIDHYE